MNYYWITEIQSFLLSRKRIKKRINNILSMLKKKKKEYGLIKQDKVEMFL